MKLTTEVNTVLRDAKQIAEQLKNENPVEFHFLYAILKRYFFDSRESVDDQELYDLIHSTNPAMDTVMEGLKEGLELLGTIKKGESETSLLRCLTQAQALNVFLGLSEPEITCRLMLIAMIDSDQKLKDVLTGLGITKTKLYNSNSFGRTMEQDEQGPFMGGSPIFPTPGGDDDPDNGSNDSGDSQTTATSDPTVMNGNKGVNLKTLKKYSICLTDKALLGELDPVFGRDKEMLKLQEILCCRKKNNGVLLGDPGVGKTAVVEALAQKIAEGKVPRYLIGKKIYSLDLNAILSGAMYRGQYEERLQKIIKEVIANKNEVIVYIDELHNLIGSGSSSGNGDAANILKPYLARGEFQCIGSTTLEEYRKFIEKDGALKRRFQEVLIVEPTSEQTEQILESIKEPYQAYHGVTYGSEVIKRCVLLSERYVTDRFFPDKAIDILDLAGSKTKLAQPFDTKKIDELKKQIEAAKELKKKAIEDQDFEAASKARGEEIRLNAELAKEESPAATDVADRIEITVDAIDKTISELTNIPIDRLGRDDFEKIKVMKDIMQTRVIGQSEAINAVTTALQRNALGLRDRTKPIASFLMVGPTGTGKTQTAKTLATEFFGSENAMVRIDCSTLADATGVSSLTGSKPGYVGYDDKVVLDDVRTKKYCVVLFDEIEKAHHEVRQTLLSVLDDGYIIKGNGVKIDFRNTIIIFTSNTGTKSLQIFGQGIGFQNEDSNGSRNKSIIMKEIQKTYSPEFINRLTGIIHFNSLSKEVLSQIAKIEIQKLQGRVSEAGIQNITVTDELIDKIIEKCDTKYGARDLQREIIEFIENPLTDKLLETGKVESPDVEFSYENEQVLVKFK